MWYKMIKKLPKKKNVIILKSTKIGMTNRWNGGSIIEKRFETIFLLTPISQLFNLIYL